MADQTTRRRSMPLTIRADHALLEALDALSAATGASRHAVLLLAAQRGVSLLTEDDARQTLPFFRRRPAAG